MQTKRKKSVISVEDGHSNPAFINSDGDFTLQTPVGDLNSTPKERQAWGNEIEFLMSCIAMSVGLGNIWRFPFTARANGGGAFLIPYLIVLTVIGRPMYYMEMALGQFSSLGNVKMYQKISPVLKTIGYGQLIGSICVCTYYCSLMAITLFYLVNSFTGDLPWTNCWDSWKDYLIENNNLTCVDSSSKTTVENAVSSSELYFKLEVLREIDDITSGIGLPSWQLTLGLLVSWIVTAGVSIKGVASSGKASYFLALFPYVVMTALLIRACTLPGAADGMYYFIETDWSKLADAKVWYSAVTQCFFSLNIGFGSVIMYSSYNNFHHNINRDALVVTTLDTFTSLLSGCTIFGIMGNLAYETNKKPEDLDMTGGTSLAFISYPEAIAKFDAVPWLFAILFFFMLFILGIGSLVALQGTLMTVIKDSFPKLPIWLLSCSTAVAGFSIGLLYVTPGGQYMLDLVDHFGGTFVVFLFAILEVTAVAWLYGTQEFCWDLEYMTGAKVSTYWRITWSILMPGLLIIIFVYFLATLEPLRYGVHQLLYPAGAAALGWTILGIGVIQLVLWVVYYLYSHREYPFGKMIKKTFSTKTWQPNSSKIDGWVKFKEEAHLEWSKVPGGWLTKKLKFLLGLKN